MAKILFSLFTAAVILIGNAGAEEKSQYVWMADGVYAVAFSDAWSYEADDDGRAMVFSHRDYDNSLLVFDIPVPEFKGDKRILLGAGIGLYFAAFRQKGEVFDEAEELYDDVFPMSTCLFAVPNAGDPSIFGVGMVIDFDGYPVVITAFGDTDQMKGFLDEVSAVVDSYIFDEEDAKAQAQTLRNANKAHLFVVESLFAGRAGNVTAAGAAERVYAKIMESDDSSGEGTTVAVSPPPSDDPAPAEAVPDVPASVAIQRTRETPAASDPTDVGNWGDPVVSDKREWTILVYLDADNDLEPFALLDVKEMEQAMAKIDPGRIEVIVLLDRAEEYDDSWDDWTGTRVYRVVGEESEETFGSRLVYDCGELDMADPATLENFINEATRVFPARKTAAFLWNHGGGWADLLNDFDRPVVMADAGEADAGEEEEAAGGSGMTLNQLRYALSRTAVNFPDGKIDLLVLDMCLMGQAETLVAIAPYVKYLVASPSLAPASGMDYRRGLPLFVSGFGSDKIAIELVKTAFMGYRDHGREDGSMAAYDLSAAGALLSSYSRLARKLNTLVPIAWPYLTRSLFLSLNYGGRDDLKQRSGSSSSIDLLDWLARLKKAADIAHLREMYGDIADVERVVGELVLHHEAGPVYRNSTGLAVYAPLRRGNMNDDYFATSFGAYTNWAQMLIDLHHEQVENEGSPPRISSIELGVPGSGGSEGYAITPVETASASDEESPLQVKITVDGINILWVTGGLAVCFDGSPDGDYIPVAGRTILNQDIVRPAEAAKSLAGADGDIPVFRDGRNVFTYRFNEQLTALLNEEEDEVTLVFPRYFDAANMDTAIILGEVKQSGRPDWERVLVTTYQDRIAMIYSLEETDGVSLFTDIVPGPNDRFRPLFEVYRNGEQVGEEPGPEIRLKQSTRLGYRKPKPGEYVKIMCMAESLAGRGSVSFSQPVRIVE